ncbi:MAG: flagellar basal body P-ring formation protein FlgA [Planctomycetia bacterium]|nr:MAG: flagellar basal body P-ring formation protein FlgA [Planctomycetia bacterium]
MLRREACELSRNRAVLRGLACVIAVACIMATARAEDLIRPGVSRLTIKPRVTVSGRAATLADVLWLREADPQLAARLGGEVVLQAQPGSPEATISHSQIVEKLESLGVNPARVLVGGALQCRVSFGPTEGSAATAGAAASLSRSAEPASGGSIAARSGPSGSRVVESTAGIVGTGDLPSTVPGAEPGAGTSATVGATEQTLADAIRAALQRGLGSGVRSIDVAFERVGAEFLELTSPPFEFDIRTGADAGRLGMREITVALRRDGRQLRTLRIGVQVRAVRAVVTAARAMNVGAIVRREDLQLQERVFDGTQEVGRNEIEPLVGHQVKRFIPAGEMIRADHLKAVDLVKRSTPVTVLGDGAAVSLRVVGVALDAGGYGDVVRVRLGEGRNDRREVRGIVTAVSTVRIMADPQ